LSEEKFFNGFDRLTIPEKVRLGLKFTLEEHEIAKLKDVYDKVEAGIL